MTDNTCGTCKWWGYPFEREAVARRECHRFPPTVLWATSAFSSEEKAVWPMTSRYSFCGEHQPKDKSDDPR